MKVTRIKGDPANIFETVVAAGTRVRMGRISFQGGQRVPDIGTSSHAQEEHSYVLSGSLTVTSGGASARASAGDLISIQPGESHFTEVTSDAAVVYLMIG